LPLPTYVNKQPTASISFLLPLSEYALEGTPETLKNALFTEPPTRKMTTLLPHKKLANSSLFWRPDQTPGQDNFLKSLTVEAE